MSPDPAFEPVPFEAHGAGGAGLRGDRSGEGPPIVQLHGLTAGRRYVTHGSKLLSRRGFEQVAYDARGHGESDPAGEGEGYSYAELSADLGALLDQLFPEQRVVLAGHSMGAHTLTAYALANPDRVAALIAIGPTATGQRIDPQGLAGWDRLADGLARGGVEGFLEAYDDDLDPEWRETLLRIARERLSLHRHPEAVAKALRSVPRSMPFDDMAALEALKVPTLIVASHDEADPGHPYAVAERWSEVLPNARLMSEEKGASPLAWQGGRLSRAIAEFCAGPEVSERLSA